MEGQNIEIQDKPSDPKKAPKAISRRKFIELGVKTFIGGTIAVETLENGFFKLLFDGIRNPQLNDTVIAASLKICEQDPKADNPNFRPITEIIKEGLDDFQNKTGIKPFFQRDKDYKNADYYADSIKEFANIHLLHRSISKASATLTSALPLGACSDAYYQASGSNSSFEEYFTSQSGLDERFRERHPELVHKTGLYKKDTKRKELMDEEGRQEMSEAMHKVEMKSTESGRPVSTSFVLEHFLEKSKGNIGQSIYDTALFLKFMARNTLLDGSFSATSENADWFIKNIKDEYQGPPYTNPPSGESAINLIGKPYHSWNLVALLQFVPIEVVRIGGVRRQLLTFSEQGLAKTKSDLRTLKDMRKIEQLLLSYS